MERRVALATAGAVTSTLLAGTVAFAATTGAHILGFGSTPPAASAAAPQVVTQVQTITDQVVVLTPTTVAGDGQAAGTPGAADPAVSVGSVVDGSPAHGRYTTAGAPGAGSAAAPPGAATDATTTVPSTKWPTTPIGGPTITATPAPTSVPTPAAPAAGATTVAPAAPAAPVASTPSTVAAPAPVTTAAPTTTRPPSTTAPATTTAPAATTTTRPPGVPADWPASKPIPPMPPGCTQGQLEDNGVWNCQN